MLTARECRERAELLRARAMTHPDSRAADSYRQLALLFDEKAARADARENAVKALVTELLEARLDAGATSSPARPCG